MIGRSFPIRVPYAYDDGEGTATTWCCQCSLSVGGEDRQAGLGVVALAVDDGAVRAGAGDRVGHPVEVASDVEVVRAQGGVVGPLGRVGLGGEGGVEESGLGVEGYEVVVVGALGAVDVVGRREDEAGVVRLDSRVVEVPDQVRLGGGGDDSGGV